MSKTLEIPHLGVRSSAKPFKVYETIVKEERACLHTKFATFSIALIVAWGYINSIGKRPVRLGIISGVPTPGCVPPIIVIHPAAQCTQLASR